MFEELLVQLNILRERHQFHPFVLNFYSDFLLKLVCSLIDGTETKKANLLHTIFNSIEF